jgi:peptidyl-prolyl cis-trans isomerase A (cyclophilin A)
VIVRTVLLALLASITASGPADAAPAPPSPAFIKVKLDTSDGPIVIALDMKHAPITSGNFLAYVDQKRLDGTTFYRASRGDPDPKKGFVEGGINNSMVRSLKPIKHEPTSVTGLRHVDGTVSMARDDPGTAMGDFFIVVGSGSYLDATRKDPGYAAFGHVVEGMAVVHRMLAAPTYPGGRSRETIGQSIIHPIHILSARRVVPPPAH